MNEDLSTRNTTESEDDFLRDLRVLMNKHQVEIQYDPRDVPVFCDEVGVGIFLSIHDVHLYLPDRENK